MGIQVSSGKPFGAFCEQGRQSVEKFLKFNKTVVESLFVDALLFVLRFIQKLLFYINFQSNKQFWNSSFFGELFITPFNECVLLDFNFCFVQKVN